MYPTKPAATSSAPLGARHQASFLWWKRWTMPLDSVDRCELLYPATLSRECGPKTINNPQIGGVWFGVHHEKYWNQDANAQVIEMARIFGVDIKNEPYLVHDPWHWRNFMLKLFQHQAIPRHWSWTSLKLRSWSVRWDIMETASKRREKWRWGLQERSCKVLASERKWVCLKIGVSLNSLTYNLSLYYIPICH